MRDPRDPGGEYERDAGFGVYCAEERPWTADDWVNWVMNHKVEQEKPIHELVHEVVTGRHIAGKIAHDRPFTKDTYDDNLKEAIEEAADLLFYLVALREKMNA